MFLSSHKSLELIMSQDAQSSIATKRYHLEKVNEKEVDKTYK